jgi:hypothetical protein
VLNWGFIVEGPGPHPKRKKLAAETQAGFANSGFINADSPMHTNLPHIVAMGGIVGLPTQR